MDKTQLSKGTKIAIGIMITAVIISFVIAIVGSFSSNQNNDSGSYSETMNVPDGPNPFGN